MKCLKSMENCFFPSLGKRESKTKKMVLMKTAIAYLIMIRWLFQDNLSQKMRERKRWPIFYCCNYLCAFSPSFWSRCCDLMFNFFFFFDWHCNALVHGRPAQNQGKSSAEGRESTRHWFFSRLVRVKPGLTISTVSRACDSCQHISTQIH